MGFWVNFSLEIVKTLAWPVTVLFIVILLRRPLIALIPNLQEFRYKDFRLRFGQQLQQVEARAEKIVPKEQPVVIGPRGIPSEEAFGKVDVISEVPVAGGREDIRSIAERLAAVSPRAAIAEVWRQLEFAVRHAALRLGVPEQQRSVSALVRLLEKEGTLPREASAILDDLRSLRNQAVHANEFQLTSVEAIEFAKLAEIVVAFITPSPGEPMAADDPEARSAFCAGRLIFDDTPDASKLNAFLEGNPDLRPLVQWDTAKGEGAYRWTSNTMGKRYFIHKKLGASCP